LLNILPCFGVLAAQGWNLTQQSRWVNRAVLAGLTAWAAASYAAFFAR